MEVLRQPGGLEGTLERLTDVVRVERPPLLIREDPLGQVAPPELELLFGSITEHAP